jgi:hypothetical protein
MPVAGFWFSLAGRRRRGYSICRMNDPFQLVVWAVAIGVSWWILAMMTGCDRWMRSLFGQRDKAKDLEAQIKALDARVKDLENKK